MKTSKLYTVIFLLLTSILFSCAEDKMPSDGQLATKPYYMQIDNSIFSFGANTNLTAQMNINSKNVAWEITGIPGWLKVAPASCDGSAAVAITAEANNSVDETRVAVLELKSTIENYKFNRSITITQSKADIYINPSETSINLTSIESSKEIVIESNVNWIATASESWVMLAQNGNKLSVTVEDNYSTKRTAYVELRRDTGSKVYATIYVVQEKTEGDVSSQVLRFDVEGGSKIVNITADGPWNAICFNFNWLTFTPDSGGVGTTPMTVTATANYSTNDRDDYISIHPIFDDIHVIQEGIDFKLDDSLESFEWDGADTQEIVLVSDMPWKILYSPEWLNVTPTEGGSGTTELEIKATENRSLNARSGTLRIGIEGLDIYDEVVVTQNGMDSPEGISVDVGWEAADVEVDFALPSSWSAMVSDSWFSLSKYQGEGEERVTLSVQTNDNEDARTGTITLQSEGKTFNIGVTQQGQYLRINSTAGEFEAQGGAVSLTVSSSVGADAIVEYSGNVKDWISVNNESDGVYKLSVSYNPSSQNRTAVFVVMPTKSTTNDSCKQGAKFNITQKGRTLQASVAKIEMLASGGTSGTYRITADGKYSITKDDADNWYMLQHDAELNTFNVIVSQNTTSDIRTGYITLALEDLPEGESKTILIEIVQYDSYGGVAAIDLGLPSGIKWATCNVGATKPEDYGGYYAWGETEEKSDYAWETYKWCNGSEDTMTKYCTDSSYGTVDNKTVLEPEDDVAHVKWGGSWRMPTLDEIDELINECNWQWTSLNGVNGYRVTGPNGNSIFLPAAGFRYSLGLFNRGANVYYCSSSLNDYDCSNAYFLYFLNDYYDCYSGLRYCGHNVRPVSE